MVKDYCRYIATEQDGARLEKPEFDKEPFSTNT